MLMIFDVDDTLLQTLPVAYEKSSRTASILGLTPLDFARFKAHFGRLSFADCLRAWHGDVDADAYLKVYDSLAAEVPYRPVPGVAEVLDALVAAGHDLAVMTNGPGAKTTAKLAAARVDPTRLRFVRHADNARHLKPSATAFADLVADFDIRPEDSVYVSDRPEDGLGAHAAGFGFVGVCTGVWSADDFHAAGLPADRVCADLREVPALLTSVVA